MGCRFYAVDLWNKRRNPAFFLPKVSRQLIRPITCSAVHRSRREVKFVDPFKEGAVLSFTIARATVNCVEAVFRVAKRIDFIVV